MAHLAVLAMLAFSGRTLLEVEDMHDARGAAAGVLVALGISVSGHWFSWALPEGVVGEGVRKVAYAGILDGRQALWIALGALALAVLYAAILQLRLRSVVGRLGAIVERLQAVRKQRDFAQRLRGRAKLDTAGLSEEINSLLGTFEERESQMMSVSGLHETTVESAGDAIVGTDERGTIQIFNGTAEKIFGLSADEAMGENVKILMPEPYHSRHDQFIASYVDTGMAQAIGQTRELLGMRKDGDTFPISVSLSEGANHNGRIFTAIIRDITTHKIAQKSLRKAASYDALTSLMNRHSFDQELDSALISAKRSGNPLSLCVGDVDHFKGINDRYGHQMGDEVLKKLGEIILAEVREIDLPGRFGGDEFSICFTSTCADEAVVAVERIRECFSQVSFGEDQDAFRVRATFGLADLASPDMSKAALFEAADQSLYMAKERGRNQVCVNGN